MRKIVQISVFLLISTIAFSQNVKDFGKEQAAIIAVLDKQSRAWNEGNINKFMEEYAKTDSLRFIGKSGVIMGWQATLERYKKTYPDKTTMGELHFNIKKIELFDKTTAWVLGEFHLTRPEKGNANGIFTLILKKQKGKWKIFSDHTTGY